MKGVMVLSDRRELIRSEGFQQTRFKGTSLEPTVCLYSWTSDNAKVEQVCEVRIRSLGAALRHKKKEMQPRPERRPQVWL